MAGPREETTMPGRPDRCHTCGSDPGIEAAVSNLQVAAAAVTTTNARLTPEIAALHAEISKLAAIVASSSSLQGTGNGNGAGSMEIYHEMMKSSWHGRLGRTTMAEVDKLPISAQEELDCYLRRTIKTLFPVGEKHTPLNADIIFATLSAFGIRLEDRGPLADVQIQHDENKITHSTVSRIENFGAFYYKGSTFVNYWRGVALETILQLARYRGLLDEGGFVRG